MAEDPEFIAQVKDLADNGTLKELLRRIESDCVDQWKIAPGSDARELAWFGVQAIKTLRDKITSLKDDEKVRKFNQRRIP